jgi:hypothetical protein
MPGPIRNPTEAFQQLEAIMLRQMLQSSGAFRASSTPGAQLRTDMFIETLADAVAKAGGLGIAKMLERQLGPGGSAAAGLSASASASATPQIDGQMLRGLIRGGGVSGVSGVPGLGFGGAGAASTTTIGAIDDLDDPNSEAPLPEDPSAPSIDDYQVSPSSAHLDRPAGGARGVTGGSSHVAQGQRVDQRVAAGSHSPTHSQTDLHFQLHPDDSVRHGLSKLPAIPTARALNRYRERVEATGTDNSVTAGVGEKL